MKQYLKGTQSGLFFVLGKGFVASCTKDASVLTDAQVASARNLGFEPSEVVKVATSYAVNYIREGDAKADGSIAANKRNPSKRRFATKDEAIQHGSRFQERRKKAGDEAGTAGHIGFYVTVSDDEVNAEINWKTGLTNPLGA